MEGVLHVAFRVSDPARAAQLFAELLDGEVRPTPLEKWGVVCAYITSNASSWLENMLEFWPPDKHWREGRLVDVDPTQQKSYGHVALVSSKSFAEMKPIADRYGFLMREEDRGMSAPVPVLYDDLGNYYEFFPRSAFS